MENILVKINKQHLQEFVEEYMLYNQISKESLTTIRDQFEEIFGKHSSFNVYFFNNKCYISCYLHDIKQRYELIF